MSRALDSSLVSEVTAERLAPIYLFDFIFDSSPLYFWTGIGSLSFGGNTYTGSGNVLKVTPISETGDIESKGIVVTLAGIPSSLISVALSEHVRNRPCNIWFGTINPDSGSIIGQPYRIYKGKMDAVESDEDPSSGTATLQLRVENNLVDLVRNRIRYYTTEDQALEFAGDLGFSFVPFIQDRKVVWGGQG